MHREKFALLFLKNFMRDYAVMHNSSHPNLITSPAESVIAEPGENFKPNRENLAISAGTR
jgi:hypothetical protein